MSRHCHYMLKDEFLLSKMKDARLYASHDSLANVHDANDPKML